ncbi:MAG: preprotein translocase subunit YajC [Clostridia bacterium]|nr:preprotein translocase subunit YajC [Clostridia bacterium]
MLLNLLTSTSVQESTSAGAGGKGGNFPWFWVVLGVLLVFIIISNAMNNKKRRAQMEAEREKRNAIKPGFKVTTIGGILGTVVEVDDEANSFVLQTGTEENPCFLKFDKVAIYNSEDPNAPAQEPENEHSDDLFEQTSEAAEDMSEAEETVDGAEKEPADAEEVKED